jgi:hypothetical protein
MHVGAHTKVTTSITAGERTWHFLGQGHGDN